MGLYRFIAYIVIAWIPPASGHGYQPPFQTAWQQAHVEEVAVRAARKSKEALPALLSELDDVAFREELQGCCPSLRGKTAEELLYRIQQLMSRVEVVSGFSASANHTLSYLTGMSVHDGLTGTYFQSLWQRLVRHNGSFSIPTYIYGFASKLRDEVDKGARYSASLWVKKDFNWIKAKSGMCATPVELKLNVSIGKCTASKKDNLTVRGELNASGLVLALWDGHVASGLPDGASLPCPGEETKPDRKIVVPTVQGCHAILSGATDTFYKQQDRAEGELYGLKPFVNPGHPMTWEEASERGVYSLINTLRFDAGSPLYGDVSAVFASSAARRTSLVSAVDTGFWIVSCNVSNSSPLPEGLPHNCSAYDYKTVGLGTLEHFNHVLLANHRFWKPLPMMSPLSRIFARLEGAWGTNVLESYDFSSYFETMTAGTFFYPSDIRFLIATFPSLFGTATGELVREWAMQQGWVLLWSLGVNMDINLFFKVLHHHEWPTNVSSNNRIIDPFVAQRSSASKTLNLSQAMVSAFDRKWKDVLAFRAASHEKIVNTSWLAQWQHFASAMEKPLHIDPLHPDVACPPDTSRSRDVPECVGVTRTGVCVCYDSFQEAPSIVAV